ncbi:MAG TPA: fructose-1,6-bisphosphate aldolase/phosphatase [Dehalococcoidia bacterium]|nr:fructose-1,6-bisphosphate aldolase/phosphatase [Dehalococcoidia bacterium]
MKITLSVIKADVGGYVGHASSHPEILEKAEKEMAAAKKSGMLVDYCVMRVGDDLELIMTHKMGEDCGEIHKLAWDIFCACTTVAKKLKLYGAGQDLLADAFSGNVKGMGPGVAEMEITEREGEPVIIFMADKTAAGAWNLPLYKMFADPFNSIGLVIAPGMHNGFSFEVHDVKESKKIIFKAPEEMYDMLMLLGAPGRFALKSVYSRDTGNIAASSSTQRLSYIAGRYVGKDDPVCIVRAQGEFPAVGEVLEPFANANIVQGWMRGSHHGPLMPVGFNDCDCTRFDGPPRVIAAGFQLNRGHLVGPQDLFVDMAFNNARQTALNLADALRSMGPFEPHRLPLEEMEYTTLPQMMKKLKGRFEELY